MGITTAIAWTDHTFNPWWGCERVSPGCQHCYAESFAKRTGNVVWGKNADRRRFGVKHWNEPLKWNRQAEQDGVQRRVFCASMADVFEDRADHLSDRAWLFELISDTPHLIWQLLTKRPQNVMSMVPDAWESRWPSNVWIGTTVEDQQRADERIPILAEIPAAVRFVSCEPMLGHVDLSLGWPTSQLGYEEVAEAVQWVICGGESGANHRPFNLDAARQLRDQCAAFSIPFFFKQVGGRTPTAGGDLLDGEQIKEFPAEPTPTTPRFDAQAARDAAANSAYPNDRGGHEGLQR